MKAILVGLMTGVLMFGVARMAEATLIEMGGSSGYFLDDQTGTILDTNLQYQYAIAAKLKHHCKVIVI